MFYPKCRKEIGLSTTTFFRTVENTEHCFQVRPGFPRRRFGEVAKYSPIGIKLKRGHFRL